MNHEIQNISPTTENAILRKSAYGLPNRPSESGMRADDIKKAFYSAVTDDNDSVLSEMKRIVGESNEIFKSIDNEKEESDKKTEDNTKDLNELKNNISQLSNPNLLINGDFRVNQRGQTSYSGTAIYTIDRWESREPSLTIQPLNDFGVKLIKSAEPRVSTSSLSQAIEDYKYLLGKTVTLSCKYKNNNISGGFQVGLYTSNKNEYASKALTSQYYITDESGIYSETITLPEQLDYSLLQVLFRFSNSAVENQSVEIEYVKLEIGSIATQYNPRPYAEELAMCQRYYINLSDAVFQLPAVCASGENIIYAQLFLPTTLLRTSPTITDIEGFSVRSDGSVIGDAESVTINNVSSLGVRFKIQKTGLTNNALYCVMNCKCNLDAEIY